MSEGNGHDRASHPHVFDEIEVPAASLTLPAAAAGLNSPFWAPPAPGRSTGRCKVCDGLRDDPVHRAAEDREQGAWPF